MTDYTEFGYTGTPVPPSYGRWVSIDTTSASTASYAYYTFTSPKPIVKDWDD